MPNPIEAKCLRAHDQVVITCWWDENMEWFNVRQFRADGSGDARERTIRLSVEEAKLLVHAIHKTVAPNPPNQV
jgi:hypothetical protein